MSLDFNDFPPHTSNVVPFARPAHGLFPAHEIPMNIAAEQALLGALLANNAAYDEIGDLLRPEHFADEVHAKIFAAIREQIGNGRTVDAITLKTQFENDPAFGAVGGAGYLADLLAAMVLPRYIEPYARTIRETWYLRQLLSLGETLAHAAVMPGSRSAAEIQQTFEARLLQLAELNQAVRPQHVMIGEAVQQAIDHALAMAEGRATLGLSTGMASVDARIGGLEAGTLTVIGGRPGMGKSSLVTQWAVHVASQGLPVALFSLEMSSLQLGRRVLAEMAGIPLQALRTGDGVNGNVEWAERMVRARRQLERLPLTIDDANGLTPSEIDMKCRQIERRHGALALVVIDHLHIVMPEDADAKQPKNVQVANISNAMKRLAKRHDLPVLLAAQLGREVEKREDHRPTKADLRWAGEIEQDADTIGFVYREEYYLSKGQPPRRPGEMDGKYAERCGAWEEALRQAAGKAELILAKVRDGEECTVPLLWHGERTCFAEVV